MRRRRHLLLPALLALLSRLSVVALADHDTHVCPVVLPLPPPPSPLPDHVQPRVIDGRYAAYPDVMYHASLSSPPASRLRRCTATRLSKRWLLTAAHCRVTSNWTVSLSAPSIYGGLPASIVRVVSHPNYTDATDRRFDIAAIEVRPPSYEAPSVPVVFLNEYDNLPKDHAFVRVSGYGKSTRDDPTPENYGALRFTDIPVYPFSECRATYERLSRVGALEQRRQVCAGYEKGGCDACSGDSGGPLIQYDQQGRAVQVALVSAAYGCALEGYPGINARVDAVLPWLRQEGVLFDSARPAQVFRRGGIHAAQADGASKQTPTVTPSPLPLASFPVLTPAPGSGNDDGGDAAPVASGAPAATVGPTAAVGPTVAVVTAAPGGAGEEEEQLVESGAEDADEGGGGEEVVATAAAEEEEAAAAAESGFVARDEEEGADVDGALSDVAVGVAAGVGGGVVTLLALALVVLRRGAR